MGEREGDRTDGGMGKEKEGKGDGTLCVWCSALPLCLRRFSCSSSLSCVHFIELYISDSSIYTP